MFRFSLTIILFFNLLFLQAQDILPPRCPYKGTQVTDSRLNKIAEDFTITTTDGVVRNLYNTLDSGKTVFIDLFYTTCYYCQLYSPVIEEAYLETGAGEGDVEFWGISNNLFDTNSVIDQYKENYNVSNPCAGPWGGGLTAFSRIVEGQEFYGFPTYCVICPDRYMYFGICYPPVPGCIYPYFEDCTVGIVENDKMQDQAGIVSVYPNPATDGVFAAINLNYQGKITIEVCNSLGVNVYSTSLIVNKGLFTQFIPVNKLPAGIYLIKLVQNDIVLDVHNVLISKM